MSKPPDHRCGFDYPVKNGAGWCNVCKAYIPLMEVFMMNDVFRYLLFFHERIETLEVSMKST